MRCIDKHALGFYEPAYVLRKINSLLMNATIRSKLQQAFDIEACNLSKTCQKHEKLFLSEDSLE